jgi:hypothetical protein
LFRDHACQLAPLIIVSSCEVDVALVKREADLHVTLR